MGSIQSPRSCANLDTPGLAQPGSGLPAASLPDLPCRQQGPSQAAELRTQPLTGTPRELSMPGGRSPSELNRELTRAVQHEVSAIARSTDASLCAAAVNELQQLFSESPLARYAAHAAGVDRGEIRRLVVLWSPSCDCTMALPLRWSASARPDQADGLL